MFYAVLKRGSEKTKKRARTILRGKMKELIGFCFDLSRLVALFFFIV